MKSFLAAVGVSLGVTLAAIGFSLWPTPALSQGAPCTPEDPTEHLLTKFQERVTAYGTSEAGAILIRIFANLETGTWTIVLSQAAPPAHCLISAGEGFEILPAAEREKPTGTSASHAF